MISGVILARNESENIAECILALRPHVGEVIVIDMESEDETVSLAQPLADKILSHPIQPNFDSARNIAIPEARFDWLWFVDADERIPHQTGQLVNELVRNQGGEFEAINVPFKSYFCGKWIQHSGWWPGYTMPRVLKRGYFQFSQKLHGGVELSGKEIRVPPDPNLGVDHFSYESVDHYIEKFNRYTSTEALQLKDAGQSPDWRNAIAHMVHDLWMYYECNNGLLDGRHGWLLAWLSGQYRWLSHAKLLDVADKDPPNDVVLYPQSLDEVIAEIRSELERVRCTQPVLPLGVTWRSPIWDPSGYADEGRCIAKALAGLERNSNLEEIAWSTSHCQIPDQDRLLLQVMQRCEKQPSNIAITNCIPTLALPVPNAALNVLRTTFEVDRIPQQWIAHLDQFDEIWVISQHNFESFVRSGIAPEKLKVVPSFLDTSLYCPDGPTTELPEVLKNRFVFLSVFDWQMRKGWDLLLGSYCTCFDVSDETGLLLKISRAHGISMGQVLSIVNEQLMKLGQTLENRPDIVIVDDNLSAEEMACLYRSVDAFVLPSRGEGWGRPYMEAMACGVPTIGTGASGNIDFMTNENCVLVDADLVKVPRAAIDEIPVYDGCRWFEPNLESLSNALMSVRHDPEYRARITKRAKKDIDDNHSIKAGSENLQEAIDNCESRFVVPSIPVLNESQIRINWEGEFFAGHSFSNINEQLAAMFMNDDRFVLAIERKFHNPTFDRGDRRLGKFSAFFNRSMDSPDVTIRHAFPPNWTPPQTGRWIHIQPWEFGHLPNDWIGPLKDLVDEVWCPTEYVRTVYERSGIHGSKLHVIPWGIDPSVFNPEGPTRILNTNRSFKFLFVGGSIQRKGFDTLLQAYLEEFDPNDDVCLVVKDIGTSSFYRYGNLRDQVLAAQADKSLPEIIYFEEQMDTGSVGSIISFGRLFSCTLSR